MLFGYKRFMRLDILKPRSFVGGLDIPLESCVCVQTSEVNGLPFCCLNVHLATFFSILLSAELRQCGIYLLSYGT